MGREDAGVRTCVCVLALPYSVPTGGLVATACRSGPGLCKHVSSTAVWRSYDAGRLIAGALSLCVARGVASYNVCVVLSPGRAPGA